jgi:hypothetical protein
MSRFLLSGCYIFSAIAAWMYVFTRDSASTYPLFALILLTASALVLLRPKFGLYALPIIAMLGPIARIRLVERADINVADAYIIVLIAAYCIRRSSNKPLVTLDKLDSPIYWMLGLSVVSACLSTDMYASGITLIGIVQYAIVYWLTRELIKSEKDSYDLLRAWILAICISAVMVLYAYKNGISLLLDPSKPNPTLDPSFQNPRFLFRPTFLVAGFIFPLSAILMSLLGMSLAEFTSDKRIEGKSARLILLFVALAVVISCVVVMANKTTLVSVLASTIIYYFVNYRFFNSTVRTAFGLALLLSMFSYVGYQIVPEFAQDLWVTNVTNTGSLEVRFSLWPKVVQFLLSSPKEFLVGMGPDFSVRNASMPVMDPILISQNTREGAVDNTYLYLTLNYGIIFLVVGLRMYWQAISFLLKRVNTAGPGIQQYLFISAVTWAIMGISQQCGIMKPAFMLVQVFAITNNIAAKTNTEIAAKLENPTAHPTSHLQFVRRGR